MFGGLHIEVGLGISETFSGYVKGVFLLYILFQLDNVTRLDIVWDVYVPGSLKAAMRGKCRTGTRKRVSLTSSMPTNWQSFLWVDDNKTELFQMLAAKQTSFERVNKQIFSTLSDRVLCSPANMDKSSLEPCTHEEADSRLILHLSDAALKDHRRIMIQTSDTDVVILIIANMHKFPQGTEV